MLSSVCYGVRVFIFAGAFLAALAAPRGLQAEEEPASRAAAPAEAPQPEYAAGEYMSDDEANEATISALRAASRQLDDAAELLEQQNLFERADELREQADRLRRDARAYLKERSLPAPHSQTDCNPASAVEPVEYHVPLKVKIDAGNLEKYREGFETRHPETRREKKPKARAFHRFLISFAR